MAYSTIDEYSVRLRRLEKEFLSKEDVVESNQSINFKHIYEDNIQKEITLFDRTAIVKYRKYFKWRLEKNDIL